MVIPKIMLNLLNSCFSAFNRAGASFPFQDIHAAIPEDLVDYSFNNKGNKSTFCLCFML